MRFPAIATAALVVAALTTLSACRVESAQAAPSPRGVALSLETENCPADSLCFRAFWNKVSDNAGAADHYVVAVAVDPGADYTDTTTALSYRIVVARPAPSDTVSIEASVWSLRRGKLSQTFASDSRIYVEKDQAPPAPDSIVIVPDSAVPSAPVDSEPPVEPPIGVSSLIVTPRALSPHFSFIRRTFTDFCYCWTDPADQAWAAKRYDLVMSGNAARWDSLNSNITHLRYALMQTSFTEEPDKNGRTDANSLEGKWQYDARAWFQAHPEYDYEKMWLHDTTTGTPADSAHRLRGMIWNNYRYAINPLDPGARAYTVDRLKRSLANSPASKGLFLDEMDHGALGWIKRAREGRGVADSVWQKAVLSLVAEIRSGVAPGVLQTNAAEYSLQTFDQEVAEAAGGAHLELMNAAMLDIQPRWAVVDSLLAHGTYVDFVGREMWTDYDRSSWNAKYPGGFYESAPVRIKVVQLANYYMVVDSLAQRVGMQSENVRNPVTPDSTDLMLYYVNVGHPRGARRVWLDVRDAVKQRARVFRRDFDNAVVLVRPQVYWADTIYTDTTKVSVPVPEGGPWNAVSAKGMEVPVDSLSLRNSDAVILVRRKVP